MQTSFKNIKHLPLHICCQARIHARLGRITSLSNLSIALDRKSDYKKSFSSYSHIFQQPNISLFFFTCNSRENTTAFIMLYTEGSANSTCMWIYMIHDCIHVFYKWEVITTCKNMFCLWQILGYAVYTGVFACCSCSKRLLTAELSSCFPHFAFLGKH